MTRASTKWPDGNGGPAVGVRRQSRPRGRGRPRDAALRRQRREQILAQATQVFARDGYPNTDVQFVADPLGISKGTVYRYFPSKERLFLAAVERGVRRLERHMDRAVEPVQDPLNRIAVAVRAHLEFFRSEPELVELFIQERAEFRDRRKPVYFEHGEANCGRWRDLIAGLVAAGRLRPAPVDRVMNVLGDLVYGTMFKNHMTQRQAPFEAQAADIVDVVFNGILSDAERGRRSRRPPDHGRPDND